MGSATHLSISSSVFTDISVCCFVLISLSFYGFIHLKNSLLVFQIVFCKGGERKCAQAAILNQSIYLLVLL